jgi:hypothetical protein
VSRRRRKIGGRLPRAAGSKGDKGVEVKGDEIGEGCKGVVALAEFSGVAGLRRETCLGDTEFVGEGGDPR